MKSRTLGISATTIAGGSVSTALAFLDLSSTSTTGLSMPASTKASSLPNQSATGMPSVPNTLSTSVQIVDAAGHSTTEVFVKTVYTEYLTATASTTASLTTSRTVIPIVIGPSGIGWNIPVVSGSFIAPPGSLKPPENSVPTQASSSPPGQVVSVATTTDRSGKPTTQTFTAITYPDFVTLQSQITITTSTLGTGVPLVIGPSGIG